MRVNQGFYVIACCLGIHTDELLCKGGDMVADGAVFVQPHAAAVAVGACRFSHVSFESWKFSGEVFGCGADMVL